jgi:CheY-like chemotaxis protein
MKVLVIDDTQVHLDAALQTLAEHDVTICLSHEEATKLIHGRGNDPYWDAVLCDLLMPAGPMAQGGEGLKFVGQEMPVGWALAIGAAVNGAKFVAVATDMNHHHHPASAMLDNLGGEIFTMNGAKAMLTNHVKFVGIKGTEGTCTECWGTGKTSSHGTEYKCGYCKEGVAFSKSGKDWGYILRKLQGLERIDNRPT